VVKSAGIMVRIRSTARHAAIALALGTLVTLAVAARASATTLSFTTAPVMGALSGVALNGLPQTTPTTWNLTSNPFAITSSGTNSGWNLTVRSTAVGGGSSVFKQYCPSSSCGSDSGPGYVTGGFTLPAGSLTLDTTGAGWTTTGTQPAYQCSSGCTVDSTTATKIVSAQSTVALGTWQSSGSATLSLSTPSTLRLLQTGEYYRINLVWTAATGP
jgi:hypothetical protein